MSAIVPTLLILAILVCLFIGMTETKVKEEVNKKLDQDIGGDPGSGSVH
ncbi:MAG: hypothetical protein ABIO43_11510 [Sphingomicrobium sp.]